MSEVSVAVRVNPLRLRASSEYRPLVASTLMVQCTMQQRIDQNVDNGGYTVEGGYNPLMGLMGHLFSRMDPYLQPRPN